ncbi:MAG: lipase/esterase, partial [Acidobacteria bacterium]|nr:lipase/esterase [Acidobacteriota bacterium]
MATTWTRRLFLGTFGAGIALSDVTSLAAQGPATSPGQGAGEVEKDVVFGKGGDVDLHCDIYRPPAASSKRMAILHFHGGGFAGGNKNNLAARLTPLTAMGYVNIAVQYRLSGVARWPAQIEDVKAAIRWTRANASRLGIDPRRIGVAG